MSLTPKQPAEFCAWGKLSPSTKELHFLSGPLGRLQDLWQALRIFVEFLRGFRALHFAGPCVTVFGSARFSETHPYYELARETGRLLAQSGFTVMTGGGPGVMEGANRGAKEVGGYSIASNIKLPKEQHPNPYLDRWVEFEYFLVRKAMLRKYSYGFIALPGGYGTLDELFETLTLVQTRKMTAFPMVLIGKEFWQPLVNYIEDVLLRNGTISPHDRDWFLLTDSTSEAVQYVNRIATEKYGLTWRERRKPRWWLLEG